MQQSESSKALDHSFATNEIQTHSSDWSPDTVQVTLNARIDARLVPCAAPQHGLRLSYGHIVVLDSFIGENERKELIDLLTQPGWDHSKGPPTDKWERETADGAGLPKTWGLRQSVLNELAACKASAMKEVHTRLAKLYPEYHISHMPADLIQHHQAEGANTEHTVTQSDVDTSSRQASCTDCLPANDVPTQGTATGAAAVTSCSSQQLPPQASQWDPDGGRDSSNISGSPSGCNEDCEGPVDCNQFVGNAAVYGDCYTWHVDADPAAFPPSPWVNAFGSYCNGEPGRPLFVSLLLYLDDKWPRHWDAETLFLDDDTDIGIVVRPKRFRAVLMDQDVLHRVSTPSQLAGIQPRYSLVWKLVFVPLYKGQQCCIAKASWGQPTDLGSAAKVAGIKRSMLQKRKADPA